MKYTPYSYQYSRWPRMLKRSSRVGGKFQGDIQLLIPSSASKHINMFYTLHVKGKGLLGQVTKAQGGVDVYLYSSFNLGTRLRGWPTPRPGRFTPVKDPIPIV